MDERHVSLQVRAIGYPKARFLSEIQKHVKIKNACYLNVPTSLRKNQQSTITDHPGTKYR